jgi:hypothetical protein
LQGRLPLLDKRFQSHLQALLMLLLIGLNSCGSSPPPEEAVRERALERWQALMQRDMEKAYGYLSPGYRAVTSLDLYRARFGSAVRWTDANVKKVACTDKACDVTVNVHYQYMAPSVGMYEGEKPLEEKWVQVDKQWWLLPKN